MIREWLKEYNPQNQQQTFDAIREIMQEVTLAGLQRSGFFEKAAFYGGTALRIFYQLDRYSEDLDFSLLSIDPNFSFEPYFEAITNEFKALGMTISINEKKKTATFSVESAFLKSDTIWKELVLEEVIPQAGLGNMPVIKIKIEVDKKPPLGFETEDKLLLRPFSFYIKCFTLPSLFAGKMHALLFRKWKNRVKGRDWYDLEWYIKKGVPLDINHFLLRAQDTNDWKKSTISKEDILDLLKIKINTVNMNSVKEDIVRFIPDHTALDIWSQEYFSKLIQYLKFDSV
ncbi:nucleotidyl transferase AbiEii/AbiGii toxin family protein [Sphingobacterium siyangense]|uniref:Putative nucleotidyltransferase component of viral defense system n=1 Tax=Sphingobacterium siyangense TaxID=459529 RepID=A0A562MC20_9SPHI|nr:nucleotidyl transferase AbiEii/AbiGii toxin family protein [Sphingobacterium siyangense]TWI17497.1 putative nucleotidyltransferase component of viral defense system [Sphingobacterium siyangense]